MICWGMIYRGGGGIDFIVDGFIDFIGGKDDFTVV